MSLIGGIKLIAFGVYNSWMPRENPKALPFNIPFLANGVTSYLIDLNIEHTTGVMEFVQGIFIDNSLNSQPLSIVSTITQQKITAPPNTQGWYSILAPSDSKFQASTTGNVNVPIFLVNYPVANTIWNVGATPVSVTGNVNVLTPVPATSYASNQTPFAASAQGIASAIALTMPAVAAKTNYISGFDITGLGATGASEVIANINNGAVVANYSIEVPAGATTPITPLIVRFNPPIAGSAVNIACTLNVPSFGAGNTDVRANLFGFVQ